jgi:hypothetical protein
MKYAPRRISTATVLCNLGMAVVFLFVIHCLTSCGVRMEADGAKEFSVDSSAFAISLEVFANNNYAQSSSTSPCQNPSPCVRR